MCLDEECVIVVEKTVANGKNFAGDGSDGGPSVEFLDGAIALRMARNTLKSSINQFN